MPVTTVFRDKIPRGMSFPLGAQHLDGILVAEITAVYFVNTSTWLRHATPLDGRTFPVLPSLPEATRTTDRE